MKWTPHFKRVIVYARHHRANTEVIETLNKLTYFLSTLPIETYLDEQTAQAFSLTNPPVLPQVAQGKKGDMIVVIGGDGSLLSAARKAVDLGIPVIGVNRGRLGFLTDISPQEMEKELLAVLQGHYVEEQRFLLRASIESLSGTHFSAYALNDVVISRGTNTHLMAFDVLVNQELVSHYRADGIIFSTPTGSTAYALSAGGPIVHPALNAVIIAPMFSHRLSSRPLVIDALSKICLKPASGNESELQLSADSHEQASIDDGQWVCIEKHRTQLKLLHPMGYDYFDTLRYKLGWEGGREPCY